MREMAEMQRALKKLVVSCHGDDDSHCPILDELTVSSFEAPEAGVGGAKPIRKAASPSQTRTNAPPSEPSTHVDLMA